MVRVRESVSSAGFPSAVSTMWRYSELLPVHSESSIVSLGEGWTPLIQSRRLHTELGLSSLMIKDDSRNPTSSFKDRGLCAAVSKHLELGAQSFALPSAGNAAVSMSAYCAAAGVKAHVFMPADTPSSFFDECSLYGAETTEVKGTIADCSAKMKASGGDWTDLSTTKEPYRVEGKKTLGFEISEQLAWSVPDAVICPTGGGTALIGIWKALKELEEIGLVGSDRPRMYAVQSEGCAPVVKAIRTKSDDLEPWSGCNTQALGLRVPRPFAGKLILDAIRSSHGSAVSVPDKEIKPMELRAARMEGLNICPEAAIGLAGLKELVQSAAIDRDETVVMLNTGSGDRYRNNGRTLPGQ